MAKHQWGRDDVCKVCGVLRSRNTLRIAGGQLGDVRYYNAHGGALGRTAPACVAPSTECGNCGRTDGHTETCHASGVLEGDPR